MKRGHLDQSYTFKKKEFYLQCLFKRILKLQVSRSRKHFLLFSLWPFSLKSKPHPVSTVSGLAARGAIRLQSYVRHCGSPLWAAAQSHKYAELGTQRCRDGCRTDKLLARFGWAPWALAPADFRVSRVSRTEHSKHFLNYGEWWRIL